MTPKIIFVGNERAREVELGQELTIGRAYSNLLRLDGDEISRVHAIIYRRGNEYVVRDLDSKNGVSVNEQKVSTAVLKASDEIRIGQFHLLFEPQNDDEIAAFCKKHNAEPPAPPGDPLLTAGEKELRTMIVSKTDPSRPAVDVAEPRVFFAASEVGEMVKDPDSGDVMDFYGDMLRLNVGISMPGTDSSGGELPPLQVFLHAALGALGADRGVIILKDGASDDLKLGAIMPLDTDVAVNRVVLKAVLKEGNAVLCNGVQNDPRFHLTETVKREKIGSLIAHPLLHADKSIGLIYADTIERSDSFRSHHLVLLYFVSRFVVLCQPDVLSPA